MLSLEGLKRLFIFFISKNENEKDCSIAFDFTVFRIISLFNIPTFNLSCKKEKLLVAIKRWQKAQMIPNFVELVDGDNKLLISLINENSVKMLLHTIKNRTQFILEEFLFTDREIIKNEKENSFSNQFVISFYNKERLKAVKNESPRQRKS